jgi:hypothetical protein
MIPGITSKISESTLVAAATIIPKTDMVRVTGTTAIATIVPPYAGFSGILLLSPDAAFTTVTTGNISLASTAVANKLLIMAYSKVNNKWYPSY